MTGSISIDINQDVQNRIETITPPWTVWRKGNKKKLFKDGGYPTGAKKAKEQWFQDSIQTLQKFSEWRIWQYANNQLWYVGEFDRAFEYSMVVPGRTHQATQRKVRPRIFNHLYDLTEQRVSKLSALKPAVQVFPTNREENDREITRLISSALKAVERRVRMDLLIQNLERWTAVFGEMLIWVEWNPDIGDRKERGSIERVGDVDIYLKEPWTYFPEPKADRSEVTYVVDLWDIKPVEEARELFDNQKIEPDGSHQVFFFNNNVLEKRADEVIIYRLLQKPTKFFPEGNISWFVHQKDGTKLQKEEKVWPYSHMDFPFEIHTDIDVPGRQFGVSAYQNLIPMQHVYNRLTSIMVRNMLLVGHPHILMPEGSAKVEAFTNRPTAIKYKPIGNARPEIVTFPSVPGEFFNFRNEVRQEMGQVYGIQGVTRGDPPPNVRAASMLRFYEEQEQQRASTLILKHNEIIRQVYYKTASVVGDYYPADKSEGSQQRLIRTFGKDNKYVLDAFDVAKISSEYDVFIANSTGFSESIAGRLEEVALVAQLERDKQTQLLSAEEMADILDLKDPQKAYDIAGNSRRTAEFFNELLLSGKKIPEPKKYWDLLTHWRAIMILMNSSSWPGLPEEIQENATIHLTTIERLITEKIPNSPALGAIMERERDFPALYNPEPQPPEKPAATAQPQGMEALIPEPGAALPPIPGASGGLPIA